MSSNPQFKEEEIAKIVDDAVNNHKVAIFAKSWCPYCSKAKVLIGGFDLPEGSVKSLDLDQIDPNTGGTSLQPYLAQKPKSPTSKEPTNHTTVPSIWINQKFVGGYSDVVKLNVAGPNGGPNLLRELIENPSLSFADQESKKEARL